MAQFKTAKDQRMVPFDVSVVGTVPSGTEVTPANRKNAICRGDFVVLTPATSTAVANIQKATQAQVTSKTATHIVALTDQTMSNNFVRTDNRDYRSSELVGSTAATAPTNLTAEVKKVGLYPIFYWDDIIQDSDANDVK